MEQPSHRLTPADEVIVRAYRRLLGVVGGIAVFLAALQLMPPFDRALLAATLPTTLFGAAALWARSALSRPRPAAYWATVAGFGGVVASIVIASLLRGDLFTPLVMVFIWGQPLRALRLPSVRRALSGDDDRRGGLRRRLRETRERLAELLRPRLQPAPVPVPLG